MPRFEDDEYADYGVRTKNRADGAAKTRRKARKPVKRGSVSEIVWDDRAAVRPTSTTRFADPDMQRLFDRGYFDTLVGPLRGGKEAMVYVVKRGDLGLVAKLYTDRALRAFQNDAGYWAGYWVDDVRVAKAMRQGSRAGQRAKQGLWVFREYQTLWRLHEAGLPVPRPAVGPDVSDMGEAGSVVRLVLVLAVFCVVQVLDGYFITPRIQGKKTGLSVPVIIFSLLFWGVVFRGLLGVLLAIPLSAFIVVVWRLLKNKYIKELI